MPWAVVIEDWSRDGTCGCRADKGASHCAARTELWGALVQLAMEVVTSEADALGRRLLFFKKLGAMLYKQKRGSSCAEACF
mmetsp:Transcript_65913/g.157461  ORF Transcript_65913/g.157461 Transcript_65913/m.157461 type:complete len:81 (-) Transcript_65913:583-825(-)